MVCADFAKVLGKVFKNLVTEEICSNKVPNIYYLYKIALSLKLPFK